MLPYRGTSLIRNTHPPGITVSFRYRRNDVVDCLPVRDDNKFSKSNPFPQNPTPLEWKEPDHPQEKEFPIFFFFVFINLKPRVE
jgi:hypothetical protein